MKSHMSNPRRSAAVTTDADQQEGAIMASLDPAVLVPNSDPVPVIAAAGSAPSSSRHVNSASSTSAMVSSNSQSLLPDVLSNELQSLNLHVRENGAAAAGIGFLLMDNEENLQVANAEELAARLGCEDDCKTKVVVILGNTGEGKSYALNHALFDGDEVFETSSDQRSCTLGVRAAYQPVMQAFVLDTEGMMGDALGDSNEVLRKRMLLKVLAVADVVILCTKAERMPSDLFLFLGDASKTYNDYFSHELRKVQLNEQDSMHGPSLLICHETRYTDVLPPENHEGKNPETVIRDRLTGLDQDISAFSKITYLGAKVENRESNALLERLTEAVKTEIASTSLRRPRSVTVIYDTLQALTTNFKGDVDRASHLVSFADEYFTCSVRCSSCDARCEANVNHSPGRLPHRSASKCVYQKMYENKRLFCTKCHQNGFRVEVVHKSSSAKESALAAAFSYVWSGNVLECSNCGVIYRDREKWQGNMEPEKTGDVIAEITHIWPGERSIQGTHNAARRLLDSVNHLSGAVSSISAAPTASVSRWMADQVSPEYWRPNKDIIRCNACGRKFEDSQSPHHCRACGEGFCGQCSSYKRPCVERGWGEEPQRSCKKCYDDYVRKGMDTNISSEKNEVQARKVTEKVSETLSGFTSILSGPISAVKDLARPAYWVPDDEIASCYVCDREFGFYAACGASNGTSASAVPASKHHCRKCGNGVCDPCSKTNMPVQARGWDNPVRVCDKCVEAGPNAVAVR